MSSDEEDVAPLRRKRKRLGGLGRSSLVVSSEEDSPTPEYSEENFELPDFVPSFQGPLPSQKDKGKAVDLYYQQSEKGSASAGLFPSPARVIYEGPSVREIPVTEHGYRLPLSFCPSSSNSSSFLDIPFDLEESR